MATDQSTVDFLLDQMSGAGFLRARKMFGEYAIYCNEKVVALVCDDKLYIKPTEAGRKLLKTVDEAPPYPGAKNYFHISGDYWEEREWLSNLISITVNELPMPKPKKKKAS